MFGAMLPLPPHVSMAWCSVKRKHRDNSTFTFTFTFAYNDTFTSTPPAASLSPTTLPSSLLVRSVQRLKSVLLARCITCVVTLRCSLWPVEVPLRFKERSIPYCKAAPRFTKVQYLRWHVWKFNTGFSISCNELSPGNWTCYPPIPSPVEIE